MKPRANRGVFVAGTDTGVGKTLITAGLVVALREMGVDAVPMKPIQTGCVAQRRRLAAPDLDFSLRVGGLAASPEELRWMCPYRFQMACSPHLAAARAGVRIGIAMIRRAFDRLAERHEVVVVEGAGGVLVPLGPAGSMLTLMTSLDLPVVLVARAGLGTLNHTLLTLNEIRRAGLRVAGLIVNQGEGRGWGTVERDNCGTLARLGKVPVLATIRNDRAIADVTPAAFARFARKNFRRLFLLRNKGLCETIHGFPKSRWAARGAQKGG